MSSQLALPKEVYGVPSYNHVDCYERLSTAKGQATRRNKKAVIGIIDKWITVDDHEALKLETPKISQVVDDLADWLDSKDGDQLETDDPRLYDAVGALVDRLQSYIA